LGGIGRDRFLTPQLSENAQLKVVSYQSSAIRRASLKENHISCIKEYGFFDIQLKLTADR
jgi:hypothetical protein